MSRTGKITIYEGIGKTSKKPFTALKLDITPTLSKLYFLESRFEMDHAVEYLKGSDQVSQTPPTTQTPANPDDGKIDLNSEDEIDPSRFPL